jgi:voltage-gated potassium channel
LLQCERIETCSGSRRRLVNPQRHSHGANLAPPPTPRVAAERQRALSRTDPESAFAGSALNPHGAEHQKVCKLCEPVRTFWSAQVFAACLALTLVVVGGGVGIWWLTDDTLTLTDSIYFALITVATVGYNEPPELQNFKGTHVFVGALIIAGLITLSYFQSALTALLVEGRIGLAFRRRSMQHKIAKLRDHIIVAGCGRTGKFCAFELAALKRPFVVIDRDPATLRRVEQELPQVEILHVIGDATEDHALLAAGVGHAHGLVAVLSDDRDNAFVVLSARTLNPRLHIVAKVLETENEPKLRKAGADKLVSPHRLGGFRLVSELVRPKTMEFLDGTHAMSQQDLHMEDVELKEGCPLIGKTLHSAPIRATTNALVVAVREPEGSFIHNPPPEHQLRAHSHLIVVGDEAGVAALRALASCSRAAN